MGLQYCSVWTVAAVSWSSNNGHNRQQSALSRVSPVYQTTHGSRGASVWRQRPSRELFLKCSKYKQKLCQNYNTELKVKSQTIQFIIGKIKIRNRQYVTRISSGWYSGKWLPVDDICMTVSECVAWVTGSGQIMSSCVTISQLHQHLAGVSPLLCSICQHGAARPISVQQWPYSEPWRPGFAYSNLHWHCTFAMCQCTICVLCVRGCFHII